MFRASEFKCKEVINLCDGERMGFVCDLEIENCTGQICAIIVPGRRGGLFGRRDGIVIPWRCIQRIGEDLILVRLEHERFTEV